MYNGYANINTNNICLIHVCILIVKIIIIILKQYVTYYTYTYLDISRPVIFALYCMVID